MKSALSRMESGVRTAYLGGIGAGGFGHFVCCGDLLVMILVLFLKYASNI